MSKKGGKRAKKKSSKKKPPAIPTFSDEMLKVILDESHEGKAILGDDYIIEYVNERTCEIFSGTHEDLIGHDFREFLREDVAKLVADNYERRRLGEDVPDVYPIHIIRKDGTEVIVELRVSVVLGPDGKPKTIAHVLDITQIEADLKALEESKTRYRMLVENMSEGLAIDDENGKLTYVNRAFCDMLGYEPEEIVGMTWTDLTEEMDEDGFKLKREERKTGVSASYELIWRSKTGEKVPTIISATPFHDREGNFVGTYAVVTEISAQKEAEETVQFYLDLLSHDIANQLQVIMTSTGLLEEEVPPTYIDDARKDILDAVERCNRLITKVKRAAQIRHIPLSRIDAVPVIHEKIKVLERVYGAKVHIKGLKKTLPVEADVLLGEMIWNLLENAARHNPKEEKQVWITCEAKDDSCNLIIADDGPGLSDMRKKTLFTERTHGGGVGITLVSQMIRKYGGSIEVQDRVAEEPALGSKFIVTLKKAKPRKKR
ncbi:MAG: PAS domain-containing sensor histidine kinase [Candidatus Thorarchaeota archaeon]|jgi:PAS domain S-box-containing protein